MDTIGLFPLKNVLFPESAYPLHIFEKRYKELIADCLIDNVPFGYVLKMSEHQYPVGCLANVSDIMTQYDDGRMDILVTGTRRFTIIANHKSETTYSKADIEFIDDIDEQTNSILLLRCIDTFNILAESVRSVKIEKIIYDKLITDKPSYLLAQKSGMSLVQKQNFLEVRSENMRLKLLLDHLQRILPMIREAEFVSQIIKNDGYYTLKK
jgi:Lon protease-like protein